MMSAIRKLLGTGAVMLLLMANAQAAQDRDAPKIVHQPPLKAVVGQQLTITATITDRTGVFEPTLYYRAKGTSKFFMVSMLETSEGYSAQIPEAVMAADIEYFIEAYDVLGNGPALFGSNDAPQLVAVAAEPSPETPPAAQATAAAEPSKSTPAADKTRLTTATSDDGAVGAQSTSREARSSNDMELRDQPSGMPGMKIAGLSAAGVGAASLLAGVYFGLSSKSLNDDARDEPSAVAARQLQNDARSRATLANVTLAVGGVLLVGGTVLGLLPQQAPATSSGPSAGLVLTLGGAAISGRF